MNASDSVLELRNVTKFFGDFRAVDDVSFRLPRGSIYGFLGPNGAGKTTTLRMILEIIKPTSGSITILGRSSALAVRQRIGYLPEEKGLYKKMKAWSIIAYFATLKGMNRSAARRRALELLERHGLKDFAEKPTEALSKGMGQKVQVLAAIAHDPELVILDEPCNTPSDCATRYCSWRKGAKFLTARLRPPGARSRAASKSRPRTTSRRCASWVTWYR